MTRVKDQHFGADRGFLLSHLENGGNAVLVDFCHQSKAQTLKQFRVPAHGHSYLGIAGKLKPKQTGGVGVGEAERNVGFFGHGVQVQSQASKEVLVGSLLSAGKRNAALDEKRLGHRTDAYFPRLHALVHKRFSFGHKILVIFLVPIDKHVPRRHPLLGRKTQHLQHPLGRKRHLGVGGHAQPNAQELQHLLVFADLGGKQVLVGVGNGPDRSGQESRVQGLVKVLLVVIQRVAFHVLSQDVGFVQVGVPLNLGQLSLKLQVYPVEKEGRSLQAHRFDGDGKTIDLLKKTRQSRLLFLFQVQRGRRIEVEGKVVKQGKLIVQFYSQIFCRVQVEEIGVAVEVVGRDSQMGKVKLSPGVLPVLGQLALQEMFGNGNFKL